MVNWVKMIFEEIKNTDSIIFQNLEEIIFKINELEQRIKTLEK